MNFLFDTNVVLDIWRMDEQNASSYHCIDLAVFRNDKLCLTAAQFPTIAYLMEARKLVPKGKIIQELKNLHEYFEVLDTNEIDFNTAILNFTGDFEDDMIMQCAARHDIDFLVTRNIKDFKHSPVPVLTPESFIEAFKPTCLHYEVAPIDLSASEDY